MKLPPYPNYKPSGVEWLGDVPEHWEVKQLRHLTRFAYGAPLAAEDREEGPIGVFGSNGQVGTHVQGNTLAPVIVVGRKGSFGKVNFSESSVFAIDTTYFIDRKQTTADLRWLSHLLWSLRLDTISKDSAVPGLAREDAYTNRVALPPPAEQAAIAAYLDGETGRVDRLVAKKRELIERLKEKRAALISRTVTRGLPAEAAAKAGLPANPPLKPSVLDWLGDIPKHWEEMTIKRVALSMICGPFGSSLTKDKYTDSGYRVYGQEQVIPGDFSIGDYYISTNYFSEMKRYEVRAGDVLVSCVGTFGKAAVVPEDIEPGIINPRLILIRPDRRRIDSQYMGILIRSHFAHEQLQATSRGGTMDIINLGLMGDLMIPLPPLPEQTAIAAYLDEETAKLDTLVGKVEEAVERLQEYRTALITAAVTGKIDVRSYQDNIRP
jgi:type I restriction enzyme S subunit